MFFTVLGRARVACLQVMFPLRNKSSYQLPFISECVEIVQKWQTKIDLATLRVP